MKDNNILAVVLAGGKSKRFGKDKNQAKLGDTTLLGHVLRKLSKRFEKILIIANQDLNLKKSKSISIIPDCIKGNLGPLIGILSAMKWIKEKKLNYEWIASFPSDTPFFDISIIEKYENKMRLNNKQLYFAKSNQRRHNIFGLWSLKLLDQLENDLVNNNYRKVEDWSNKIGVETIDVKIEKFDPFFNINTKEDHDEAKKILEEYTND